MSVLTFSTLPSRITHDIIVIDWLRDGISLEFDVVKFSVFKVFKVLPAYISVVVEGCFVWVMLCLLILACVMVWLMF